MPSGAFERDPLGWLDAAAAEGRGAKWISPKRLCIYDADTARALLVNPDGRVAGHSDFFGTGAGSLQPRACQVALARECLALIQARLRSVHPAEEVAALPARSEWPRQGNALLLRIMRPVLAAPSRPTAFHAALETMVQRRIFSRHEKPVGLARRMVERFRFFRAFSREAERGSGDGHGDVFEAVLRHGSGLGEEALIQLYAGFVFAAVGSVGFALGSSLLMAVEHGRTGYPRPSHLVQEGLRLLPVAWLFERRTVGREELLGEEVTPDDVLTVSPYAIHRNPAHWPDPLAYSPERWRGLSGKPPWLPFGAGEHSCVAAGLTLELVATLLAAIFERAPSVTRLGGGPSIGAALAPPRFRLDLAR